MQETIPENLRSIAKENEEKERFLVHFSKLRETWL